MSVKQVVLCLTYMISAVFVSPVFADTTADVMESESLKKLGAKTLSMHFEDSKDGVAPQKTWLQGVNSSGKVIWKKPVSLKERVNTAKVDVICRRGRIEVIGQFPGSAEYTKQIFAWNGNSVSFVSKLTADPCQQQVDALRKLAVSGTMQQLKAFNEQEHVIFYPANYINSQNVKAIIISGQESAAKLNAEHKPALAAQRMRVCLEASKDLCYLESQAGSKTNEPDIWIEAWATDEVALPDTVWKPALKDYASYLTASSQSVRAAPIWKVVDKN